MSLDPSRLGTSTPAQVVRWSSTESLLYALSVGAGQTDPLTELAYTTENTSGVAQQVIPTFAVVLGFGSGLPEIGDYDPTRAVHAEQQVEVEGVLPAEGEAMAVTTVTDMWDKGRDAIVWTETTLTETSTGRRLAASRTAAFLGGAGGFGGERGSSVAFDLPQGLPDEEIDFASRPEQALLYRLTGDRNPLHSDPGFAARGGFERPILHGMCTYGYATRLLINRLCGGQVAGLGSVEGRFTRPVFPGDPLRLQIWRGEEAAVFRVVTESGEVVIDRGRAGLRLV